VSAVIPCWPILHAEDDDRVRVAEEELLDFSFERHALVLEVVDRKGVMRVGGGNECRHDAGEEQYALHHRRYCQKRVSLYIKGSRASAAPFRGAGAPDRAFQRQSRGRPPRARQIGKHQEQVFELVAVNIADELRLPRVRDVARRPLSGWFPDHMIFWRIPHRPCGRGGPR
jgi:hypothetical protein